MSSRVSLTSNGSSLPGRRIVNDDGRVDPTAHLLDRLTERHADDLLTVKLGDEIVGQNAGMCRRRVIERRDHFENAVLHRQLEADAAKFATALGLNSLILLEQS